MAQLTNALNGRKRVLVAVCALSVCLMIAEIAMSRRIRAAGAFDMWQLELLVLPWIGFVGSYFSLVSTSWFDAQPDENLMRRALSLITAAGVIGLVTVVYFGLVF